MSSRGPQPSAGSRFPGGCRPYFTALSRFFLFREFVFSRDMLYGSDTLALGYMVREFYANAVSGGSFPLWNPIILGGTPFVESLAGGDSLYPPSALLLFLMDPYRALGWKLVLHVFLAGIFMYGWIRCLGPVEALGAPGWAGLWVGSVHGQPRPRGTGR